MSTARTTAGVRPEPLPGLWVSGLRSYAFGVRTDMGSTPMRYVVARRFGGASAAATVLFVIEPSVLLGTYVRIDEDVAAGTCAVHTYLPTMAQPLLIRDELLFDCLPLTDVGYVDLMAWRPPVLRPGDPAGCDPVESGWTRSFRTEAGDPLQVCEGIAADPAVVVRRTFRRGGAEVRRWEITEHGEPGCEGLPLRIRVSRARTGHRTEFTRSTAPAAIPPELFDASPYALWECLTETLGEAVAGTPRTPA